MNLTNIPAPPGIPVPSATPPPALQGQGTPYVTNNPPPLALPYLSPGVKARVGQEMSTGAIVSVGAVPQLNGSMSGLPSPYFFTMHYAPTDVSVSSSADAGAVLLKNTESSLINPVAVGGAFGFTMFINREQEVFENTLSAVAGPNGEMRFGTMGTMYDIEVLYRTFNGQPGSSASQTPYVWSSMYLNLLMPTFSRVYISSVLQFSGIPVSLSVQHNKYNQNMVPVYSTVTMSFASTGANVQGLDNAAGQTGPATTNGTP